MLYFAYGSNLNLRQMAQRCPKAQPLHLAELPGWKIVFRGVLDIVKSEGDFCLGAIWEITDDCLKALDRYEGFRESNPHGGMYRRLWMKTQLPGGRKGDPVLTYKMNRGGYVAPPSGYYYDAVRQGYVDFGIPISHLDAAVAASEGGHRGGRKGTI